MQHVIDRRFGSGQDIALSKTVQVDVSKAVAFAPSGDLEWVDPFVGFRIRHEMGPSKELGLEADFGGSVSAATSLGRWSVPVASTQPA